MLRALQDLFDSLSAPSLSPAEQEHQLQLATAVLLVEVMRSDAAVQPAERAAILAALHRQFPLEPDALQRLLQLAEQTSRTASDFFAFTSTLNERFSHEQKIGVVEFMWQVAYADGRIDEGENHVISRVAGLLHVTHGEYIGAKLRAKQAAGLGGP
ncbi:MAG: TerB family tellurite resistance protein [Burkholderiales bacterium]